MAHGCASSAWTIGFYALHNWMLALFDERAREEAFATRPILAPAPLAPTGRGVPTGEGVRLTGRWSWATETIVAAGDPVPRPVRAQARLAAALIVHESRAVIGDLLEASGASAHFLDNPLQRIKRDVDVICGHVVFDYDTSREPAAALTLGMKVSRTAMV